MRIVFVIAFVGALTACSGAPDHPLPHTSKNDPTWQLNPGKWSFNENDLTKPPGDQPAMQSVDARVLPR